MGDSMSLDLRLRLKAARVAEDWVKHIRFPGVDDVAVMNSVRRLLERACYEGALSGLRGEDAAAEGYYVQAFREKMNPDGLSPEKVEAAVKNVRDAWRNGYLRGKNSG
jgi:hypothetical protein